MTDHVFVGPTLPDTEVAAVLPGAVIHPPIAHGDLLRLAPGPGDRVLIIDGLFMQSAPVRHKEILEALRRGAAVAGASSMGALRAAELWCFGMRGIGQIFHWYRAGVITGDDEVAMAYGPADDGYPALSEPLVSIRLALRDAARTGVIRNGERDALIALAAAIPFRARGWRTLRRAATLEGLDAAVDRATTWLSANPRDAKASDARLLLRSAAAGSDALRPPDHNDRPIDGLRTTYLEAWQAWHMGRQIGDHWISDRVAVATCMLLHPDYPAQHRRQVLLGLTGAEPGDADVETRAVRLACQRGLLAPLLDNTLPHPQWLAEHERALPPSEAALRLLVRGFGTANRLTVSIDRLPSTLRNAAVLDAASAFVADAELAANALPRHDPHLPETRRRFHERRIDETFARLWSVPLEHLEAAVWDRGLVSLAEFHRVAEPLMAGLKLFGPPSFPSTVPKEST